MKIVKEYVDVDIRHPKENEEYPLRIRWKDGRVFEVDKVLCAERVASLKAGGTVIRFTCMIENKERYIWHEYENLWFVEHKIYD